MALVKHKTVREALQYVAKNPEWSAESRVESPVWENVARVLFDLANNPDTRIVGAVNKAVRAQKIILDRTTGTRRAGTHPAQKTQKTISFTDLTGGGSGSDNPVRE